jgi:hypothetical protein
VSLVLYFKGTTGEASRVTGILTHTFQRLKSTTRGIRFYNKYYCVTACLLKRKKTKITYLFFPLFYVEQTMKTLSLQQLMPVKL